eukprot:TRINITY_DN6794_c0_g3_i1.p1 TRINITY_DN6794_c0_g3~~TRINITY_DN6794_c0_g3_i1.p1  ORF type:complete len:739 (+),score=209.66 TRINITY_DN6794_c0_g3_i1:61-2277(+)
MAVKVSAKAGTYQAFPVPPVGSLHGSVNLEGASEKFYITTAISYTNGPPHIGHAYEALMADVIARYNRIYGRKVFFLTGTDEHGQKIAQAAELSKETPKAHCDMWVEKFQSLNNRLSISNDEYIRTTDEYHEDSCRELWQRCFKAGDIYLAEYTGWYNVREEMFVTDVDALKDDYKDAYGEPLKKVSEKCYFFKLSKFASSVKDHIESNPEFIQPESRKTEVLNMLANTEKVPDLCVSRTTFDWGIKLPEGFEDKHVMYVWFDALTNYLSATNILLPEDQQNPDRTGLWPADVHIIGKDITRFHCIYWPAMLMSAGLPLPKTVCGHGFVMDGEGRKMSKSLGNVICPNAILDSYPADSVRFYIIYEAANGADLKCSEQNLVNAHNNDLADTIGNLSQRATSLLGKEKGHEWEVPEFVGDMKAPFDLDELRDNVEDCMASFKTKEALQEIMTAARKTNSWLAAAEPWKMKGDDRAAERRSVLRLSLEVVYVLAHFLAPFLPITCSLIFDKLKQKGSIKSLRSDFLNLTAGQKIKEGDWAEHGDLKMKVLFPVLNLAVTPEQAAKAKEAEEAPKGKDKKAKEPKKKDEKKTEKPKKDDKKEKPKEELPEFVDGVRVAVKADFSQRYYLVELNGQKYPEVSGIMTFTSEGCFDQTIFGAGKEGSSVLHTEKGPVTVLTSRAGGIKYDQKLGMLSLKPHHSSNLKELSKPHAPTFAAKISKKGELSLESDGENTVWSRKRQI